MIRKSRTVAVRTVLFIATLAGAPIAAAHAQVVAAPKTGVQPGMSVPKERRTLDYGRATGGLRGPDDFAKQPNIACFPYAKAPRGTPGETSIRYSIGCTGPGMGTDLLPEFANLPLKNGWRVVAMEPRVMQPMMSGGAYVEFGFTVKIIIEGPIGTCPYENVSGPCP